MLKYYFSTVSEGHKSEILKWLFFKDQDTKNGRFLKDHFKWPGGQKSEIPTGLISKDSKKTRNAKFLKTFSKDQGKLKSLTFMNIFQDKVKKIRNFLRKYIFQGSAYQIIFNIFKGLVAKLDFFQIIFSKRKIRKSKFF